MGINIRSLRELVEQLAQLDPDTAIFVAGSGEVGPETPATLGPATTSAPQGFRYLLEVPIAQEVLEVWSAWRGGRQPTLPEKIEAIEYYARMDAYLPVDG